LFLMRPAAPKLTASGRMWFNSRRFGAVSSAVEHRLHTAGVTGSSPVLPTSPNIEKGSAPAGPFSFPHPAEKHCRIKPSPV
jgi:hypothetical protein